MEEDDVWIASQKEKKTNERVSAWKQRQQTQSDPSKVLLVTPASATYFIWRLNNLFKLRLNRGSLTLTPDIWLWLREGEELAWWEHMFLLLLLLLLCRLHLQPASELLLIWSTLVLHRGTKQGLQSSATIMQQTKDRLWTGDLSRKDSFTNTCTAV